MLLGTEIGAALTALEPLGIDFIGLNCATGPAEMSEHLRHLSRHARIGLSLHAQRRAADAGQATARPTRSRRSSSPTAHDHFTKDFGLALVGGCCGTTPEHLRQVVERVQGRGLATRRPRPEAGVASLYQHVPFRQDTSYLSIGERTNANGSQGVPRGDARGALGRLHRDRPRPDPRRRAPARRLHRLRRPRRRAGHAASRQPVRHRLDAAAGARLHRARRHRGRARAARRPVGRQLGQLRGRRRARARGSPGSCRSSASTAPPWSRCASTRRARRVRPSGRCASPPG